MDMVCDLLERKERGLNGHKTPPGKVLNSFNVIKNGSDMEVRMPDCSFMSLVSLSMLDTDKYNHIGFYHVIFIISCLDAKGHHDLKLD